MYLYFSLIKKKIKNYIVGRFFSLHNKTLSLYEGTIFQSLLIWIRRNQKISAFLTSGLMTIQVFVIRYKKDEVQNVNLILEKENSSLKSGIINKNSSMDEFPYPWWKKQASNGYFVLIDLNDAYERDLGISKLFVLGKNNFQIVPKEQAQEYHDNDAAIAKNLTDILTIETFKFTDSTEIKLLIWKGARRDNFDTILEGFAIPLDDIIKVINKNKE